MVAVREMFDVVFYDDIGGFPICDETYAQGPMGGSEIEVYWLGQLLQEHGVRTGVFSKGVKTHKAPFFNVDELRGTKVTCKTLVVHRSSSIPKNITYKKLFCLSTDMPWNGYDKAAKAGATLITLSDAHRKRYLQFYNAKYPAKWQRSITIPYLLPDWVYDKSDIKRDAFKYTYASAAVKGLKETLEIWPDIRGDGQTLFVCSPGYDKIDVGTTPGVKHIGVMPFKDVVDHFRSCEGLFYVNSFPEMWCINAAVAEACGCRTHILCVNDPAALETTCAQPIFIDRTSFKYDFQRIVRANPKHNDFRASSIFPQWFEALTGRRFKRKDLIMSNKQARSTICLNMIIKNEAGVLPRALQSVRSMVDYWVILVDPETTDNSREIIKAEMKDVPGEIVELPWTGWAGTRNALLDASKGKADYLLILDADDVYVEDKPNGYSGDLPETLTADAYLIDIRDSGTMYQRTLLFRNDFGFYYKGVAHEFVLRDKPCVSEPLKCVLYQRGLGGGARVGDSCTREINALIEAIKVEKDMGMKTRYVFYLAQFYKDAAQYDKAIENYKKRSKMEGGWFEETYQALFQIGACCEYAGHDSEKIEEAYDKAYAYRSGARIEPLYELARYYRTNERYAEGFACCERVLKGKDRLSTTDTLFIDTGAYEYKLFDEYALCAFYVDRKDITKRIYTMLLYRHARGEIALPLDYVTRFEGVLKTWCGDDNNVGDNDGGDAAFSEDHHVTETALEEAFVTEEREPATGSAYFGYFFKILQDNVQAGSSEFGLGLSLFNLVVSTRATFILEIGRFKGFSTFALASGLKFLTEHGWNEPNHHKQKPDFDYNDFERNNQRRLLESVDPVMQVGVETLIGKNNLAKYVNWHEMTSQDFFEKELDHDSIYDIIFVDGDHNYEGCKYDAFKFWTNLKPGGYMILHDYFGWYDSNGVNNSPIKRVCDELSERTGQKLLLDTGYMSFMIFRKPE